MNTSPSLRNPDSAPERSGESRRGTTPMRYRSTPASDQILAELDPDQREVATSLIGPVCVLAGAGTGKTRAITHRIAYGVSTGVYRPNSVLAVTFTARAAGEMRTRLRELGADGVQARTFHAAALRQLQFFWPKAIGGGVPGLLKQKVSVVAESAGRLGLSVDRVGLRDLSAEVEWSKVSMVAPDDYPRVAAKHDRPEIAGQDRATIARLIERYEEVKTERSLIDFEDVLLILVGILDERADIAEEVRTQYRHFVVDEYQDVSPIQQRLLDLWLGGRDELCVVGDASQTIYSFTGATPEFLLSFRKRYPAATHVRLVRDYRSTPQVVALANSVLDKAEGIFASARLELIAQRPSGPPVRWADYDDDMAEASGVARQIRELIDAGTKAREIAVLFRTNVQSAPLEQALNDAGIGYLVHGGERFFARKEVRDALMLLRGAARSIEPGQSISSVVRDVLATIGWAQSAPTNAGAARDKWESLQALVALADSLVAHNEQATLGELIAELDDRIQSQHAPTIDGVTLASLHAAKGLEWDAVFLVGVSEGLLPISLAVSDEDIEEERRLLYVGLTRAREFLALSYARARNPGGRAGRKTSRFLAHRWPDGGGGGGRRMSGRRAGACQLCGVGLVSDRELTAGRCDGCAASFDPAIYDALVTWRAEESSRVRIPSYAIIHDAVLQSIAEARPVDIAELSRVRGIGAAKLDKYGGMVLEVVAKARGESNFDK